MNKKDNSRTKSTRKKIENEFILLLDKFDIEKITIKSICEKAKINPSTFYFHYRDIYDLMEQIECEMSKKAEKVFWDEDENKFKMNILELLQLIEDNQNFYKVYVKNHGDLLKLDTTKVNHSTGVKSTNVDKNYLYQYYFFNGGATSVIVKWLENNCVDDKDVIVNIIKAQFNNGII